MVEDLGTEVVPYHEVDDATLRCATIEWCDPDRTNTSKKIVWAVTEKKHRSPKIQVSHYVVVFVDCAF